MKTQLLGKLIEVPLLVSIKIQTEGFAQVLPSYETVIKNQMNLEKVNTNQLFSEHSAIPPVALLKGELHNICPV